MVTLLLQLLGGSYLNIDWSIDSVEWQSNSYFLLSSSAILNCHSPTQCYTIYMACIFITKYFQLTNGAKTLTHIMFCTFEIKSNDKFKDQRHHTKITHKKLLLLFFYILGVADPYIFRERWIFVLLLMRNVQNTICVNVFAPFISWKYCVIKIQAIYIYSQIETYVDSNMSLYEHHIDVIVINTDIPLGSGLQNQVDIGKYS